jgi:hypothetical protein
MVALVERETHGTYRKLKPLQYGLYPITKVVGENAFEFNLPPFIGLHLVYNVELF